MLQLQFSKKAGILGAVSYFRNQHSPLKALLALIARARECLHQSILCIDPGEGPLLPVPYPDQCFFNIFVAG